MLCFMLAVGVCGSDDEVKIRSPKKVEENMGAIRGEHDLFLVAKQEQHDLFLLKNGTT